MSRITQSRPSLWVSLLPVVLLIVLLSVGVYIFGDSSLEGSSQLILLFVTAVIAAISILGYHKKWSDIEQTIIRVIGNSMGPILVLLMVGMLSGTWMHSGVIPSMIYYGLEIISARWFLLTACLICSIVSICTGSSWITIATVGVGLLGVGKTLGVPEGWIGGAIISGAYFGDKMSPLSETTNLASSTVGVDLFEHIRNMIWTTGPAIIITLLIFLGYGFVVEPAVSESTTLDMQSNLQEVYHVSPWLLFVPLVIFFLISRGLASVVVLFIGALIGGLLIPIVQPQLFSSICGHDVSGVWGAVESVMRAAFGRVEYATGYLSLDSLSATSGMAGMLNTIWLILCSMSFGGAMEASGMLQTLTERMLLFMRGRFRTVATTCASCCFLNLTASDQYLAIIIPGKMYQGAYRHQGLEPKLLSRTLEDGATVTSVLIPWNSCGMTQASVLGVATLVYAPYSFFCWLSPIITILSAAITGKKTEKKKMNGLNPCHSAK